MIFLNLLCCILVFPSERQIQQYVIIQVYVTLLCSSNIKVIWLSTYIYIYNYNLYCSVGDGGVWLNARGDGEQLVWQQHGTEISSMNRLWWPILPGKWYSKSHCLLLLSYRSNWRSHHNEPFITFPCSISHRTLCEGKITVNITFLTMCHYYY